MIPLQAGALHTSTNYCKGLIPDIMLQQDSTTVTDTVVLRPGDNAAKEDLKRETERQAIFQKVSNEILKIPNGYLKVEVLIIRWHEALDDFKEHTPEV